jgi:indole-3-glycerol phosphate synthase
VAHKFLKEILLGKKKSLYSIEMKENIKPKAGKGFLENMDKGKVNIIAEIKKASPSKGVINAGLDVADTASVYGNFTGFISGISVLTEEIYFKGDGRDVEMVKKGTTLPILRKDFIFSQKQVYESAVLGADCILLIKSLLGFNKLKRLYEYARSLELDVLVETHHQEEFLKILDMGAELIGINNRDLRKMKVDNEHIISVLKDMPSEMLENRTIVCESGIDDISYMERLNEMGVNNFLIGTHFMSSPNLEETLFEFGESLEEKGLLG